MQNLALFFFLSIFSYLKYGRTALMITASAGHPEIVSKLINSGVSVDTADNVSYLQRIFCKHS